MADADAWREVRLIPRDHVLIHSAARDLHVRITRCEVRRKRKVLILTLRNIQGEGREVEIGLLAEPLADRREQFVADAKIECQLASNFEVILNIECPGLLFR